MQAAKANGIVRSLVKTTSIVLVLFGVLLGNLSPAYACPYMRHWIAGGEVDLFPELPSDYLKVKGKGLGAIYGNGSGANGSRPWYGFLDAERTGSSRRMLILFFDIACGPRTPELSQFVADQQVSRWYVVRKLSGPQPVNHSDFFEKDLGWPFEPELYEVVSKAKLKRIKARLASEKRGGEQ